MLQFVLKIAHQKAEIRRKAAEKYLQKLSLAHKSKGEQVCWIKQIEAEIITKRLLKIVFKNCLNGKKQLKEAQKNLN